MSNHDFQSATELAENYVNAKMERHQGSLQETGLPDLQMSKERIKQIRENLQMSQHEFAEATSISVSSIRNWEQGVRQPEQAAKVLLALVEEFKDEIISKIRLINGWVIMV